MCKLSDIDAIIVHFELKIPSGNTSIDGLYIFFPFYMSFNLSKTDFFYSSFETFDLALMIVSVISVVHSAIVKGT
jgi:hypothetical protein